jgi:hypothetical protein
VVFDYAPSLSHTYLMWDLGKRYTVFLQEQLLEALFDKWMRFT